MYAFRPPIGQAASLPLHFNLPFEDSQTDIPVPLQLTCTTFPSPTSGQSFVCASVDAIPTINKSTSSKSTKTRFPLDIIALVDTSQVFIALDLLHLTFTSLRV